MWVRPSTHLWKCKWNPEEDLLQIRRNRQLLGDQTGLRLGRARLIEVPAEDLADRDLATISSPDEARWGRVELWRPWSYSWSLQRFLYRTELALAFESPFDRRVDYA